MLIVILISLFLSGEIDIKQYKTGRKILKTIYQVDYDKAVNDVCKANKDLCKYIHEDFRKWYKRMLFSIAYAESKFKYIEGIYDKDDIGYFQINVRYWTRERARKYLNFDYFHRNLLKYNIRLQTELALRIMLYNIAVKIRKDGYQKSIYHYTLLYHRLNHNQVPYSYKKSVQKILWR